MVWPVDQSHDVPPFASRRTTPDSQNDVGPFGTIVTSRRVTSTGCDAAYVQPLFVVVTLYVPGSVTVIERVVAPFDQSHDVPAFAVSVVLPFAQSASEPLTVIADVPDVIVTASDGCE